MSSFLLACRSPARRGLGNRCVGFVRHERGIQGNDGGKACWFTSSIPKKQSSPSSRVVGLTLYRQLLRWCQVEDDDVPLSSLIPPVYMEAPSQVDESRLQELAEEASDSDDGAIRRIRSLLPRKAEVKPTQLTIPIHSVSDLKRTFQATYRLNTREAEEEDDQKRRISEAFEALRSLNQLSMGLKSLRQHREKHRDRENVNFRVGQVVQHRHDRWRGIVVGWERPGGTGGSELSSDFGKTSLTTKDYGDPDDAGNIRYDVVLDSGDAHGMGSSTGRTAALQCDLIPVDDENLVRIRSNASSDYFTRFDAVTRTFVPTELLAYEFPADVRADDDDHHHDDSDEDGRRRGRDAPDQGLSEENAELCHAVVQGVQEFATRLERCVLDETSCPADRGLTLLDNVMSRLNRLSSGDVLPSSYGLAPSDVSPPSLAAIHLQDLLALQLEIVDVNFKRETSRETMGGVRYRVGQVVHHRLFGFRGVVVAWDPKPVVDVTRWDGLQDIDDPMNLPFYHVIPDQGDCVRAFGGGRSLRYVCEENLEPCPDDSLDIDVDLEPEWEWRSDDGVYLPPPDIRFKYGEDLRDGGATERCMKRIQDEFNSWHLLARGQSREDPLASKLSLPVLLELQKIVENPNDAAAVQETIKEMRKAHSRGLLRRLLEVGTSELMGGNAEAALSTYRKIVDEDPDYVEAWNKIGTCQFMLGRLDDSLEATRKVLDLDPRHVAARNGLGLIHFEHRRYEEAIDCFRTTLSIDPWSPVSAKLSKCIDLRNQIVQKDEPPS